ncbi:MULTISPECIES: YHS domain-containing (seleno)protein [Mycobacterium]|jgi:YHS domain-containing protein|uniref:YHS domain-containing (seleno)protein n=1 Tax=Mycobacterium TaxID=1763 RepID=UPI000F017808|nr:MULTISPECIES: YHS domain-containing (seleno)protein [Mycobacterium]TDK98171.1 YHS domain-containing protein [Mycobacterium paragordonae]VAZ69680.1 hypothetical protein LAUMK40_05843 [Mycobacterium kansasii]
MSTDSPTLVNTAGASGFALDGFDPVAFVTDKKPVNGDPSITAEYRGALYMFASTANQETFNANPDRYAPQFGGFCAFGVSVGALFPADIINTWEVRDGKLTVILNAGLRAEFNKDYDGNLAKADNNWLGLVGEHGK